MRNIRIEVIYDGDCQDCGGYGERDVATNKESKAGIEKIKKCDRCNGSGSEPFSQFVSLKDLAKEIKELNEQE